jgi:hypothetical protein
MRGEDNTDWPSGVTEAGFRFSPAQGFRWSSGFSRSSAPKTDKSRNSNGSAEAC